MDQQELLKKLLVSIFGIIIIALLSFFAVGIVAPKTFTAEISEELDIPKRFIWKYLTEIDSLPKVRPDIEKLEVLGLNKINLESWREITDNKGFIEMEFLEKVPDRKVKMKMTRSSFGMTGIWTYEIEDLGNDRSLLTVKEESETKRLVPKSMIILGGRDSYLKNQIQFIKIAYDLESTN